MKKIFFNGLVITTFASCATYKLTEPTQADIERSQARFPDITLQEIQEGKKLYENNCILCHKLYDPGNFSEERWRNIIPPMVKKVNKKTGQTKLTTQDEEKILKYILVMREKK